MSAKIYDFAAERQLRIDLAATRELLARPRPTPPRRCCVFCARPGHDRRTCRNPLPERVAKYGKVTP